MLRLKQLSKKFLSVPHSEPGLSLLRFRNVLAFFLATRHLECLKASSEGSINLRKTEEFVGLSSVLPGAEEDFALLRKVGSLSIIAAANSISVRNSLLPTPRLENTRNTCTIHRTHDARHRAFFAYPALPHTQNAPPVLPQSARDPRIPLAIGYDFWLPEFRVGFRRTVAAGTSVPEASINE